MGKSKDLQDDVLLPTPSAQMAGEKIVKTLKTKDGNPAQLGERAYNPKTGKHVQITLNRALQMLPTPQTSDANMRQGIETASHKRNLERGQLASVILETTKLLPTPRAQDSYERSNWKTVVRANNGEAQMTLSRKIRYQSMLPTPTAMDTVDRDLEKQKKRHSFGVAETVKAIGAELDYPSEETPSDSLFSEQKAVVAITSSSKKCLKSYENSNRHKLPLQLCVDYLLSTNDWYSNKCILAWNEKLTEHSRPIYQLVPKKNYSENGEQNFLRTPDANMNRGPHTEEKLKERYFVKKQPLNLNDQLDMVQRGMLPTPRVCSAMSATVTSESAHDPKRFPNLETVVGKALLPTPRSSIAFADMNKNRGKGNLEDKMAEAMTSPLQTKETNIKTGLKLQPKFVEWMMGYLLDWTNLNEIN